MKLDNKIRETAVFGNDQFPYKRSTDSKIEWVIIVLPRCSFSRLQRENPHMTNKPVPNKYEINTTMASNGIGMIDEIDISLTSDPRPVMSSNFSRLLGEKFDARSTLIKHLRNVSARCRCCIIENGAA